MRSTIWDRTQTRLAPGTPACTGMSQPDHPRLTMPSRWGPYAKGGPFSARSCLGASVRMLLQGYLPLAVVPAGRSVIHLWHERFCMPALRTCIMCLRYVSLIRSAFLS